jgi:hypothetical protein
VSNPGSPSPAGRSATASRAWKCRASNAYIGPQPSPTAFPSCPSRGRRRKK